MSLKKTHYKHYLVTNLVTNLRHSSAMINALLTKEKMIHPVYERDLVNTEINLPIYGRKLFTANFAYLTNVDELS